MQFSLNAKASPSAFIMTWAHFQAVSCRPSVGVINDLFSRLQKVTENQLACRCDFQLISSVFTNKVQVVQFGFNLRSCILSGQDHVATRDTIVVI